MVGSSFYSKELFSSRNIRGIWPTATRGGPRAINVEVDSLRSENNRLNAAESQVVMTMRQNAQVASEYLNKSASHAHTSIRQLLEEAETLRLVSHLLQSIDKISIVHNET
ncbi:hypothetical protein CHARACLAT_030659 [Characodon lateralis]|uniref:Endosome-associated-trafficking regulator 1 n=1 Tax=Characodon lateralis TaxID=208331 RepID=A0ABU7CVL6_9TELE|nr:hypothetical protein [Characodon lateralis]